MNVIRGGGGGPPPPQVSKRGVLTLTKKGVSFEVVNNYSRWGVEIRGL